MKRIAQPTDTTHARMIADVLHSHARVCKSRLDDCGPCKQAVDWFAGLPLPLLSAVLADHSTVKGVFKLLSVRS